MPRVTVLRHVVLLAVAACTPVASALPSSATPCAGTNLEPLAPESPFTATAFVWLDSTTLIAVVGGGFEPRANGVLVLDTAHQTIAHAWRGAAGPMAAALRTASKSQLLIQQHVQRTNGTRQVVGTLDLAAGCLRTSPELDSGAQIVIDPVNDGFVFARATKEDGAHGYDTLVRVDASALQPGVVVSTPRFDAIAYDAKTNLLVASSYGDDTVRVRDPVTFAERNAKPVRANVRTGFSLRPGRGEIAMPYTQCTPTGVRSVEPAPSVTCREHRIVNGVLIVGLDALAEVTRAPVPEGFDCDFRRVVWTLDGARALFPCNDELGEWTPETGVIRRLPRPWLGGPAIAWAPDGDTYAVVGAATIDIGSISTGQLRWQLPLASAHR